MSYLLAILVALAVGASVLPLLVIRAFYAGDER